MFKYPTQKIINKQKKNVINYKNRGMSFEDSINSSNKYYLDNNIAIIHKKPTPVQIVKVDYPKRSGAVIREAYYKLASTTDYNGIYCGHHIDFEAKETKLASFPLKNLHEHQVKHMKQIDEHGGIAFVLINFSNFDEIFFLSITNLVMYWERMLLGGRKSITRQELMTTGIKIQYGIAPEIDYIKVIKDLIKRNDSL